MILVFQQPLQARIIEVAVETLGSTVYVHTKLHYYTMLSLVPAILAITTIAFLFVTDNACMIYIMRH